MSVLTCAYCGSAFSEDRGQPACAGCPLRGGCRYIRCPHCGYENPAAPGWVTRLQQWLRTDDARAAGYGEPPCAIDAREAQRAR